VWFDRYLPAGALLPFIDLKDHGDSLSPGTDVVMWITPAVAAAIISASLDLG
jgi:hypothetical protein